MIYYIQDLSSNKVSDQAASHLITTRIQEGDSITISNLSGVKQKVKIKSTDKKSREVSWEIMSEYTIEKPIKRVLLQAQIERNYLDKMCEIAPHSDITKIVIFPSSHSQKQSINKERLNKILIRACEQSESAWKPELEVLDWSQSLELIKQLKPTLLEIGSSEKTQQPSNHCLVGPEGGWSQDELETFKEINLNQVNLGDTVYPAWLAGFTFFNQK